MSASDLRFPAGGGGWTYVWDHPRKPHVHPIATLSGLVLTEVEPPDHPWQRGLWFAVKFVDGDNFWEEVDPGWGIQRHETAPSLGEGGSALAGEVSWIRADGSTVALRERRSLTHVELDEGAYAIDWETVLHAGGDVVLDRTPYNGVWGGYSGLAFRGRSSWSNTQLLFDDGTTHDAVAPHRSRWCDLSGPAGGICILDHPSNPSHPVPFYAACRAGLGYGEGWANTLYPAFLWDGPMLLSSVAPLTFRYRVVVHDGAWDVDRCDEAWEGFRRLAAGRVA